MQAFLRDVSGPRGSSDARVVQRVAEVPVSPDLRGFQSLRDWAARKDPFDLWFKQQLKDITGIDYNQPSDALWPEQIHKYRFDDR